MERIQRRIMRESIQVASDPLLAGADGLAFLSDPNKLYVNSVTSGKLLRLDLAKEGKVTKIQRDANNPDADKGPFRLFPVTLPK